MTNDEIAALCVEFTRLTGVPSSALVGMPVARVHEAVVQGRRAPEVARAICADMLVLTPRPE